MSWLKSLISASDSRVSTLIVCLLTSLIFGLCMYYFRGNIQDSLVTIIMSLIAAVGGINITDRVVKYVSAKKEVEVTRTDDDGTPPSSEKPM